MNLKVAKFCHRASSKNLFDILTFYCLINHFSVSNISRFICHQSTAHIFAPMAPYWQWFFKSTNFSPLSWHVTWIGFWQNLTENANPHHRTTANLSDIVANFIERTVNKYEKSVATLTIIVQKIFGTSVSLILAILRCILVQFEVCSLRE